MIGYINFDALNSWKEITLYIFICYIIAPIALPVHIGTFIYDNTKRI